MKRVRLMTKRMIAVIVGVLIAAALTVAVFPLPSRASEDTSAVIYFTGIGCPHCAKVDPVLLEEWTSDYKNLVVIEYEIYQQGENAVLIDTYNESYSSGYGIPLVIFDREKSIAGDGPILDSFEDELSKHSSNPVLNRDGSAEQFDELDVNTLPFFPKLWARGRVAVKTSYVAAESEGSDSSRIVKRFLTSDDISFLVEEESLEPCLNREVQLSGGSVSFDHCANIGV